MPTGGGKSLCFQIPALALEGLTIVVSPLIALMNDQVSALKQLGVKAEALHSNHSGNTQNAILQRISNNEIKMLYVSPERLMTRPLLEFLGRQKISLIAIDEAHCVSVWGNDFRPDYVELGRLKEFFPNATTIALTATADAATQKDIIAQLRLKGDKKFLSSFERKNILTFSRPGQKRIQQMASFLKNKKGHCGIVYCLSRKGTEGVKDSLIKLGYKAEAYHAGLDAMKRSHIQKQFQDDEVQIICATIAFGMGIDKSNIRWVIHYNLPKNIEGYYQEIGRSGRDGEAAETLLFYSWADKIKLQSFIDDSPAKIEFRKVQTVKLDRMWQFASSSDCRTNTILNYFDEYKNEPCGHCDNCLDPPPVIDGTQFTQMALSGIVRTQERVGINTLVDILRGSYKQEIQAAGYQDLKTFGVGREIPFLNWTHYITQMINQGIIKLDVSDSSRLKRTPLSDPILKGDQSVSLTEFKKDTKAVKVEKIKLDLDNLDFNTDLFSELREWRAEEAATQGVPAFVIFHDKTLKLLAAATPKTNRELLSIDGIGKVKMEKYGADLLEIIKG